jgi:hypothetical protein
MNAVTVGYLIVGLFLAVFLGYLWFLLANWMENRKIRKNAEKFLAGKKDNKILLEDGRILDVNRFITFDENGNKVVIDLKGGVKINKLENGIKEKGNVKGRVQEKNPGKTRKDSLSTGADRLRRRIRRG